MTTIDEIDSWFAERGFRLTYREESGHVWADLVARASGKPVAPRYGRGETQLAAAQRAQERYEQEQ